MPTDPFTLGDAAAAGSVAGLVLGTLRSLGRGLRATVGRRRLLARRLARLAPGVSVEYVEQLFGQPTFRDESDIGSIRVWVEAEFYLQVLIVDGSVVVWSATTRKRWFRPTFFRRHVISADGASLEMKLGRTTFADLPGAPNMVQGELGAHHFLYAECHYHGNPGNYLFYVYSINQAAYSFTDEALIGLLQEVNGPSYTSADHEVAAFLQSAEAKNARTARFNTIGTIDWAAEPLPEYLAVACGPDYNRVRLLLPPGRRTPLQVFKDWWRRIRTTRQ